MRGGGSVFDRAVILILQGLFYHTGILKSRNFCKVSGMRRLGRFGQLKAPQEALRQMNSNRASKAASTASQAAMSVSARAGETLASFFNRNGRKYGVSEWMPPASRVVALRKPHWSALPRATATMFLKRKPTTNVGWPRVSICWISRGCQKTTEAN